MKYANILQSLGEQKHFHTGITDNLRERLLAHNAGGVTHSAKHSPWRIKSYVAFTDEAHPTAFEKYLGSESGRAFAKARL